MVKTGTKTRIGTTTIRICFVGIFIMAAGCTNLAEYEMAFKAGLHVISSEDFSTLHVVNDLPGAQCLLIYPGGVFVLSNEGYISSYNPEDMELIEKFQIGSASPAGYSDIVYCNLKNSAYLIGSLGAILEISLPECTVLDEFIISQSPIKLELGAGSNYLFVADGPTNRIHQVSINNNQSYDDTGLYYMLNNMASAQNPDTMLVASSGGIYLIEVLSPVAIRNQFYGTSPIISDLIAIPDDTLFVGITPDGKIGILDMFYTESPPPPMFWGDVRASGSNHIIAMGQDWQHVYVLSYLGENISRLRAYNYRFFSITQTMDIPGIPLDLEVSGNGTIYALTTQ